MTGIDNRFAALLAKLNQEMLTIGREWLRDNQEQCPICGKHLTGYEDLHHWLLRRDKRKPELDRPGYNLLLVCHSCHVPEAPELGYKCALQVFQTVGISPSEIEAWVDSLDYKVKRDLPWHYYNARMAVCGY